MGLGLGGFLRGCCNFFLVFSFFVRGNGFVGLICARLGFFYF